LLVALNAVPKLGVRFRQQAEALIDPKSIAFLGGSERFVGRPYLCQFFASALLPNGQVLAIGGYNSNLGKLGWLTSAELYHWGLRFEGRTKFG
jgi:hypothetical protein